MGDLKNTFSWSKSRGELFDSCLRAYFLYYYRSWGGWEANAPEEVRRAYVLKKLDNRWTWPGGVVHNVIEHAIRAIRKGWQVDPERHIDRAKRLMRSEYRFSAAKAYWRERAQRKKFAGLVEHEFDEGIGPGVWRETWANAERALRWWFSSKWPELVASLGKDDVLALEESAFEQMAFELDGTRVFAIPDFAFIDADGVPWVVDWKTGKSASADQLVLYALYLESQFGIPADQVRGMFVLLGEGREVPVTISPTAVEWFRERFRASVAGMKSMLVDEANNVPKEESAFPMTTDRRKCGWCPFRRVCGRDEARPAPSAPPTHVAAGAS